MTDGHTSRLESALAGRYKIQRKLGEGGMASVYLAEDIKHDRKVALKVLKPELAAVIGGERFVAEIKTTAALQHPHILPLFDSGEADGFLYYVMPYVEGESLRDRLDREKQLGVEEALGITRDVADALDYAHRQGVIHRDIKPENILLQDGRPVVADFGIAVAISAAGGGRMTETGLSLGTPHYMSPEQATADRDLTARSDVYSLACVLYEMLTGDPPHTGSTAQAILVRILTDRPRPVSDTRPAVPPHVVDVLAKALEKLPADRFRSAAEFREALDRPEFRYRPTVPAASASAARRPDPAAPGERRLGFLPWALAAVALALAGWGWISRPQTPDLPVTRAQITGLEMTTVNFASDPVALSPDGRWIVAPGRNAADQQVLYLRASDGIEWREIANTDGARTPDFSPDGQSLLFYLRTGTQRGLYRVPLSGGPALPVVTGPLSSSPHWATPDSIVFVRSGGIWRISVSTGDEELLFASDSIPAARPHLLPDGSGVLFNTADPQGASAVGPRVLFYHFGRSELVEVAPSGVAPMFLNTGHVVFAHEDQALMAVRFDPDTGPVGAPRTVLSDVTVFRTGGAPWDVSDNGILIYNARRATGRSALQRGFDIVDLNGNVTPLSLSPGEYNLPRFSPDGVRIAYHAGSANDSEIFVYDVATGASPQFTDGGGRYPVWSRSGDYIYFASNRADGVWNGYRRRADGSTPAERLWQRPGESNPRDLAPGDSLLLIRENGRETSRDLLLMRLAPGPQDWENAVVEEFLTAEWQEKMGVISPDGRFVAYVSDQEGEDRVYVQSFPRPTGRRSVSPGAGTEPLWGPGGDVLYYRSGTTYFAVDIELEPFSVGSPRELFDHPNAYIGDPVLWPLQRWDVHPGGDRFIITVTRSETSGAAAGDAVDPSEELRDLYLVTNWFAELRQRMGEGS